jgi:Ser/Thr protein kinase RdoA (MazF antagonist)
LIDASDGAQVAAAFGFGDVASFEGPVARGELGQVWRLTAADGSAWAIKEALAGSPGGAGEIVAATEFNEAAIAAGVPAPEIRRATDGGAVARVRGTDVRAFGWVELEDTDPRIEPAAVGGVVAQLHRVDHPGTGPQHPWYSEPVGAPRWDALIAGLRASSSPLGDRLARWRDEFVALEGWLRPARDVRTCHRDLFADNLRATAAGSLCVIDWDNAGDADPHQELAMVLVEFAAGDDTRAQVLAAAYADAGGPARIRDPGDFSMVIAVFGHLAERIAVLSLAPETSPEERIRLEHCFDEFDDRPLTRAVVESLLDVVT